MTEIQTKTKFLSLVKLLQEKGLLSEEDVSKIKDISDLQCALVGKGFLSVEEVAETNKELYRMLSDMLGYLRSKSSSALEHIQARYGSLYPEVVEHLKGLK